MKKSKILVVLLTLALAMSLVACGGQTAEDTTEETSGAGEVEQSAEETSGASDVEQSAEETSGASDVEQPEPYRIAFFVKSPGNPFFLYMIEGAKEAAAALGEDVVTVTYDGPELETDVDKQVMMIENAIADHVDAIVLAPCDPTALIPAVAQATAANIPVVALDAPFDEDELVKANAELVSFIGSDNYAGGLLAAEAAGEKLKDLDSAKIAVIEGMAGTPNSYNRADGFKKGMESFSNCEIVFSQPADWDQQKGYDQATNAITSNPDLACIFCCNDTMALGAQAACVAAGRNDIIIIGFDATEPVLEKVVTGEIFGSVAQYPADMGKRGIETAVKYLNGESVEKNVASKILFIDADNAQDQLDGKLG